MATITTLPSIFPWHNPKMTFWYSMAIVEDAPGLSVCFAHSYYTVQSIIDLAFPKFCPAWVAPLLLPICKPITLVPAFSCSSVNSLLFSVASVGPRVGPPYPFLWAALPNACMPFSTCLPQKEYNYNMSLYVNSNSRQLYKWSRTLNRIGTK